MVLEHTGEVNNSILYAGYQYDEETSMYYINARMYNPVTARFMQEDTYVGNRLDPLSLNLYTYGHNNPIRYIDPTGHFVIAAILIGAAIGATIGAVSSAISQKKQTGTIDKAKVIGSLFEGAIIGGVGGLVGAVGLGLGLTVAAGAGAGFAENFVNQAISNKGVKDISKKDLFISSATSAVSFGAFKLVAPAANQIGQNVARNLYSSTGKASMSYVVGRGTEAMIRGAAAGGSGSFTADVLDQGIDIATKKQRKYDLWRTVRRTYLGTTTGAAAGFTLGSARGGVEYIKLVYMLGSGDAIFALNKTAVAPLKQQTGQKKLLLTVNEKQELLRLDNKGGTKSVNDIIKKVENGDITLDNNMQKANYGEMKMDVYFESQGYERISLDRVTDLNAPTHLGIDGVYYKLDGNPSYVIGEEKYGSSRLGNTRDGMQMSDTWINGSNRLENAVGKDMADNILLEGYEKILVNIKPDGSIKVKKLD